MATVKCVVVTPEETSIETEADFISVPLFDGEKGVAAGHAPMIGRLGYGELRIRSGNTVERYYVDGGFVQIEGNTISIMTNRLVASGELDSEVAEEQLKTAMQKPISTPEQAEVRERIVEQARAQIRLAKKS